MWKNQITCINCGATLIQNIYIQGGEISGVCPHCQQYFEYQIDSTEDNGRDKSSIQKIVA